MKKKKVYIDMDGTIADLYGVENWLPKLRAEEPELFKDLELLMTYEIIEKHYPSSDYEHIILSMTPKQASEEYCKLVIEEKNQWLDKYFPQITKRIFMKYGNNKNLKNSKNAILIDDNEIIRNNWKGIAINPVALLD